MVHITPAMVADLTQWFDFGRDSSLAPRRPANMYEIRSAVPMNEVSVDIISLMLGHLKAKVESADLSSLPSLPARPSTPWIRRPYTSRIDNNATNSLRVYSRPIAPSYSVSQATSSYITTQATSGPDSSVTTYRNVLEDEGRVLTLTERYNSVLRGQGDPAEVPGEPVINRFLSHVEKSRKRDLIFTTRNCGLHVHISWDKVRCAHILFGRLTDSLVSKIKPFPERVDYCDPEFSSIRGDRYNALRWVNASEGHFEVRLFNGTMKLRGILNSLLMIHREVEKVAKLVVK